MSNVYIVQDSPGKNFIPAEKFGEAKYLLVGRQSSLAVPVIRKLRRELRNFTDEDYLLLVGDPVAIGVATALAARQNRGRVKVLKWDRQESCYYVVQIDLDGGET